MGKPTGRAKGGKKEEVEDSTDTPASPAPPVTPSGKGSGGSGKKKLRAREEEEARGGSGGEGAMEKPAGRAKGESKEEAKDGTDTPASSALPVTPTGKSSGGSGKKKKQRAGEEEEAKGGGGGEGAKRRKGLNASGERREREKHGVSVHVARFVELQPAAITTMAHDDTLQILAVGRGNGDIQLWCDPASHASPPWRQPGGKSMVSLVNSRTNAPRIGWHLWEIDLRCAPGLPSGWRVFVRNFLTVDTNRKLISEINFRVPPPLTIPALPHPGWPTILKLTC